MTFGGAFQNQYQNFHPKKSFIQKQIIVPNNIIQTSNSHFKECIFNKRPILAESKKFPSARDIFDSFQ